MYMLIYGIMSHIGLILIKSASKTIAEITFDIYAKHLVKTAKGYFAHQVDVLCNTGEEVSHELYLSKAKGYYTLEQVLNKIDNATSDRAKQIKQCMYSLHEDDDYILIDKCISQHNTEGEE